MTKHAILVAGMHRSGTSALTRVLNLLGAALPSKLLDPVAGVNDAGFWEPAEIAEAHDAFLIAQGSRWDDVSPLPADAFTGAAAETCRAAVLDVLRRDLAEAPLFVVKDPRVCRLLPLWLGTDSILDAFAADPLTVLTLRNPLEVAASLERRDGFPVQKSLLLWLRHILDAERDSRGRPRTVVSYDALLDDWRPAMRRLHDDLGLAWTEPDAAAAAAVTEFLSGDHRHHAMDASALRAHPAMLDWVVTVHETLAAAGRGEPLETARLDAVRADLDAADRGFGPVIRWAEDGWRQARHDPDVTEMLLADVRRQLDDYKAELAKAETRARTAELDRDAAHVQAMEHIHWLEGEQRSLQEQVAEAQAEIQKRKDELQVILGSTSWKIVVALRKLLGRGPRDH